MRNLTLDTVYDMVDTLSERKRPCDMEDVLDCPIWSESRQEHIRLGDMYMEHALRRMVKSIEQSQEKIERLEGIIKEKDEIIDKYATEEHRWRKAYHDNFNIKGCRYMFCDIPNNKLGNIFVRMVKRYLNKESYKARVKGQYLDDKTKKTEGWKKYEFGQPISKSKCLRVYIDKRS